MSKFRNILIPVFKNLLIIAAALSCMRCGNSLLSSMNSLPADGKSSGVITLKKSIFSKDDFILPLKHEDRDKKKFQITSRSVKKNQETIFFKSTMIPGAVKIKTKSGLSLNINFYSINKDFDNDGFPDSAELENETDRNSFREWFVRIAESQYVKSSFAWPKKERDCAGLIRFAYKSALMKHDSEWQKRYGIIIDKNLSDVKKFNYPEVPVLNNKIFRIRKGNHFQKKNFSAFADAEKLLNYNTVFISRNLSDAENGDILFFFDRNNFKFPYHSMIVSKKSLHKIFYIYHTGSGDIIKRVTLDYLKKSKKFYPAEWNRYFLGIYRFNILH